MIFPLSMPWHQQLTGRILVNCRIYPSFSIAPCRSPWMAFLNIPCRTMVRRQKTFSKTLQVWGQHKGGDHLFRLACVYLQNVWGARWGEMFSHLNLPSSKELNEYIRTFPVKNNSTVPGHTVHVYRVVPSVAPCSVTFALQYRLSKIFMYYVTYLELQSSGNHNILF